MWYAAHIVTYIKLLEQPQRRFIVYENVVLVEAASPEEAHKIADDIGKDAYGDDPGEPGGEVTTADGVGRMVFAGVRKLIQCQDMPYRRLDLNDQGTSPGTGTEVTYSQFELTSAEDLEQLVRGDAVHIFYEE